MRSWLLAGLLLCGIAGAQQFSGPDEARAPRSAEAFALSKAVCESNIWLGPLSGCQLVTYPGASVPALLGKPLRFIPTTVLFGSFSAPNTREVLAQFCTETESCMADAVLLRQDRRGWKALGYLAGFDLGTCLSYPVRPGQSAAVCVGYEDQGTLSLRVASWKTGRLDIQTPARFRLLNFAARDSVQCRNSEQIEPLLWEDRDRNADGRPDLTLAVALNLGKVRPCTEMREPGLEVLSSTRTDLPFYWSGSAFVPASTTRAFIARYGERP